MLSDHDFNTWWGLLNSEFPAYKQSPSDLEKVGAVWLRELRFQSADALRFAAAEWRKANAKRPHLSDVLRLCGTFHGREQAKQAREFVWENTDYCPCGCGGTRWALYLPHFHTTRDKIHCAKVGSDPIPRGTGRFVGNDRRGIPVWAIARIDEGDAEPLLDATWDHAAVRAALLAPLPSEDERRARQNQPRRLLPAPESP